MTDAPAPSSTHFNKHESFMPPPPNDRYYRVLYDICTKQTQLRGGGDEKERKRIDEKRMGGWTEPWSSSDVCGGINKQLRDQRSMYAALTLRPNVDCKWIVRAQGCVSSCMHVCKVCVSHVLLCVDFVCVVLSLIYIGLK